MRRLSFASLREVLASNSADDRVSALCVRAMGERFAGQETLPDLLLIAMKNGKFPETAKASIEVLAKLPTAIKIVNGEIQVDAPVRTAFIKACDPAFYYSNLGNFTKAGKSNRPGLA